MYFPSVHGEFFFKCNGKEKSIKVFQIISKKVQFTHAWFLGFFYYIADTSFKQAREMMQKKLE